MSKRTKIIQLIHAMDDGGAETVVKDYCLMLAKEKFDVTLVNIYPALHTANWQIIKQSDVNVITVYPWWVLQRWNLPGRIFNKFFGKWYIPWRLAKIIAREKPDVIHAHMMVLDELKRITKNLHGIKLFYTCHSLPKRYVGSEQPSEGRAAQYLIEHNGLRLIGLHQDMVEELDHMFAVNNSIYIKNGIDLQKYRNSGVTKVEERKILGLPQDAFVIGHVGRFDAVKNHEFLVEIFAEVGKQNPKAYLLMVGAGPLQKQIIDKLDKLGLHDRYQILSHRSDVNQIMQAMDIFVFPSLFEGLSVTAVEAQASGLCSVMSNTINKATFITRKTVVLPIGVAKLWADNILHFHPQDSDPGNIDDWDMRKEIKKLEKLYSGEI